MTAPAPLSSPCPSGSMRCTRDSVIRIHQEDMCQALGVPPMNKYQSEGGPAPEQIVELLRRAVRPEHQAIEQVERFVDALALNWIIAGTDAHAKNYSLLLADGQIRLAPLYDVASILPYDDMHLMKMRLAMRIDREYCVMGISGRHWRRFATANELDPEATLQRVDQLAARLPECFAAAAEDEAVQALGSELPARMVEQVTKQAARCRTVLAAD
ncbi:MAG TPA: HipA domain-containing protein [Micromonospora sp.]|nr:HipA domain-containing protein [Micromonospora sp.]